MEEKGDPIDYLGRSNQELLSTLPQTNELRVDKKENGESFSTFSVSVPRPGIEPGWVAPLVFETSASTDSAIWAIVDCECKGSLKIHCYKENHVFFEKKLQLLAYYGKKK